MVDLFEFSKVHNVEINIKYVNHSFEITLKRNVIRTRTDVSMAVIEDESLFEYRLMEALQHLNKEEEKHKQLINDWLKRTR